MTTSIEQNLSCQKINLPELSVVIHYRKDSDDRENNLKRLLNYLISSFELKEIIVVNDSASLDVDFYNLIKNSNINGMFMQNDELFKKSSAFNGAAAQARGKIIAFWDVDIIINPTYIKEAYNKILNGDSDHVYPFNGIFIDVLKQSIPLLEQQQFSLLCSMWESNDNSLEWASSQSPGGCNLISKEAFLKINGYDDRFIGWGFEDTDFLERSKKLNNVTRILDSDAICWHMHHENAIRSENPYFYRNMQIYNENCLK